MALEFKACIVLRLEKPLILLYIDPLKKRSGGPKIS